MTNQARFNQEMAENDSRNINRARANWTTWGNQVERDLLSPENWFNYLNLEFKFTPEWTPNGGTDTRQRAR